MNQIHRNEKSAEETPLARARRAAASPDYPRKVREGLEALAQIGTEEEQRESLEYLMKALAETRREEGRVF